MPKLLSHPEAAPRASRLELEYIDAVGIAVDGLSAQWHPNSYRHFSGLPLQEKV